MLEFPRTTELRDAAATVVVIMQIPIYRWSIVGRELRRIQDCLWTYNDLKYVKALSGSVSAIVSLGSGFGCAGRGSDFRVADPGGLTRFSRESRSSLPRGIDDR